MKDLILLHGALGASKQLGSLAEALSSDYKTYTFDFYGHGNNKSTGDFSIDWFSFQLNKTIQELGLNKPVIFGYSMGGYVALNLERTSPQKVSKIITLGTKFDWNPESSRREAGYLDPEKILEKIPKYAEYLQSLHGENWRVVLAKTAEMMLDLGNNAPLNPNSVKHCGIETVIGRGALDKMVTREESESIAAALPNGSFTILDEVEHPIDKIPMERLVQYIKSNS